MSSKRRALANGPIVHSWEGVTQKTFLPSNRNHVLSVLGESHLKTTLSMVTLPAVEILLYMFKLLLSAEKSISFCSLTHLCSHELLPGHAQSYLRQMRREIVQSTSHILFFYLLQCSKHVL